MIPAEVAVRLQDVQAGYGDRIALDDVDLRIERGSLLAIIGPNGAGKSTLLKVMAGLLPIRVRGRSRSSVGRLGWLPVESRTCPRPRPSTGRSR